MSTESMKQPDTRVRFQSILVGGDKLLAWLDSAMDRLMPTEINPLAQSGRVANLAILMAVVTGVLMLFWYSPSTQFAYSSLEALEPGSLGAWVRTMHRYSSDLIMLFLAVHAIRMLFARKFTGARWLPWVSGIAMVVLMWFIGWTGFWLVWDQPAQQVAITSMRFMDALPIFGEPMSRLYIADRLVPSLLFFVVFFLHMLLPLMIAIGLIFHLSRLSRVRLLPGRNLSLLIIAAVAIASFIVPAPLDDPADMALKAETLKVDAWYLTPLALGLRLSDGGLWLAMGLILTPAFALPWILGRRQSSPKTAADAPPAGAPWQTVVNQTRCHACTQCVQDCPYGAVSMVPRTDGKAFSSMAWVNPSLCVGCAVCVGSCDSEAMDLPWFSPHSKEQDMEAATTEQVKQGKPAWVALVAGDIDGGWNFFSRAIWEKRLPGYSVHFVPTAAWVRPRLVERLLKLGADGVLIVRDARHESAARDGNRWVEDRLRQTRKPFFRPSRAGDNSDHWQVLDYDASAPKALQQAALAFQRKAVTSTEESSRRSPFVVAAASLILLTGIMLATVWPSHLSVSNPANPEPEFVFSFKLFGDLETPVEAIPEDDDSRPIHMRGRATTKPRRHPVTVRLTIDGETAERSYTAKGISRDGPAIDEWRASLPPGERRIAIEVLRGGDSEPLRWDGPLTAEPRRIHAITYTPEDGFRVESDL